MTASTGSKKSKMTAYFRGVRAEMKKVVWPNKKELIKYTGIVIIISTIVALIVSLLDFIMRGVLGFII